MNSEYNVNFDLSLSEYFTSLRKAKGISRDQVARSIGLNRNTFRGYETGARSCPHDVYLKLCDYYNLDYIETFKLLNDMATGKTIKGFKK